MWDNHHITAIVLEYLSILDLENYRAASKTCFISEQQFWKHKYFRNASISANPDKVTLSLPFKRLYFQRFQREELLSLLLAKYRLSKNVAYMQQFEITARTSGLFHIFKHRTSRDPTLTDLQANLFIVEKFQLRGTEYKSGNKDALNTQTVNLNAVVYSPNTLKTVKMGLEATWQSYMKQAQTILQIVFLFEGVAQARHLGYYIHKCDEAKDLIQEIVVPDEDACLQLLEYLEIDIPVKKWFSALSIMMRGALEYDVTGSSNLGYISLDNIISGRVRILEEEKFKGADGEYGCSGYYSSLVAMAAGEIRKHNALEFAQKYGLPSSVIQLLENTIFTRFEQLCGRFYPMIPLSEICERDWGISDASSCDIILSVPNYKIALSAKHYVNAWDDGWQSLLKVATQKLVLRVFHTYNDAYLPEFGVDHNYLAGNLQQLKINESPVDFFIYVLLCLNIMEYCYVVDGDGKNIWDVESLDEISKFTKARNRRLVEVTRAVRALKEEIKWDGHPHPAVTEWDWKLVEKQVLMDEELPSNSDSDREVRKPETAEDEGDEENEEDEENEDGENEEVDNSHEADDRVTGKRQLTTPSIQQTEKKAREL